MSLDKTQLRGKQTDTYIDMFGIEWPVYSDSRIYWITDCGENRYRDLDVLHHLGVQILEEVSIFNWIEIVVENESQLKKVKAAFGRRLMQDSG